MSKKRDVRHSCIQAVSAAEFQKVVLKKQVRLKAEMLENKAMRERMDHLQKQADDSIGLIFYRMFGLSLQFSPGENHFCGGIGIHEQAVYDRQHPL